MRALLTCGSSLCEMCSRWRKQTCIFMWVPCREQGRSSQTDNRDLDGIVALDAGNNT